MMMTLASDIALLSFAYYAASTQFERLKPRLHVHPHHRCVCASSISCICVHMRSCSVANNPWGVHTEHSCCNSACTDRSIAAATLFMCTVQELRNLQGQRKHALVQQPPATDTVCGSALDASPCGDVT